MPFQSEKQRRFLHANHPEIAKRWEREYANGGISNHFRKKLSEGSEDSYGQLLDDWDAGLIIDALPGEDFTTYYNRIMKVENDTGTEEVESVNLLAENQDPLNLSQGVTTLFQAKDGGRIGFKKGTSGAPGGGDPGMTSGGGNQGHGGGADRMPVSTPKSTYTGPTHSPHTDTPAQIEEQRVIDRDKLALIGSEDDELVGWHPDAEDKAKQFRTETVIKVLKRKDLTKDEKRRQLQYQWDELKKGKKLLSDIQKGAAVHPVVGLLVGLFQGNKLKKEQNAEIAKLEKQIGSLEDWDLDTRHHAVDTPMQILEQRILDLTQPSRRDDTGGGDGPPSLSVPVATEEVAKATDAGVIDMFDAWGEIKRKQALRASLMQDEDQAKVGDWVGDQRLLVNSGGLANLFRVKNNQ